MYCEKCGKEIDEYFEHNCVEAVIPAHKPNLNFFRPDFIPDKSSAFEKVSFAISKNAPQDLNIEELTLKQKSAKGFIDELKGILLSWKKTIKNPSKENIILIISAIIFLLVWIFTSYISGPYSYMMPGGIKSVLAVLFGSFNNIPARVLHFSSIMTLGAAFIPALTNGQIWKITGNISSSIKLLKRFISYKKSKMLYIMIISLGIGMALSNFLMRNNAFNKYMVCLTLGITLFLSTSDLLNSTFVKLGNSLFTDISKLFKLQNPFLKYKIPIQMGAGLGLILSIIGSIIRSASHSFISDYITYILGVIIIIIGIVLMFTNVKDSGQKEKTI